MNELEIRDLIARIERLTSFEVRALDAVIRDQAHLVLDEIERRGWAEPRHIAAARQFLSGDTRHPDGRWRYHALYNPWWHILAGAQAPWDAAEV